MSFSGKLPVFFIPHGGGPWHVMDDAFGDPLGYGKLKEFLVNLGQKYSPVIKAILVISAHWEETVPTVHFGANPSMFYDYYGFPDFTYLLQWPAPGNPELASKVEKLLAHAGLTTARETQRGYDHGTFVPLMIAFPEAQVPVVQLSLVKGLDPSVHIAMGKTLEPLRSEGVLILGSGMSYHNMQGFISGSSMAAIVSRQFDDWLTNEVVGNNPDKRNNSLINWEEALGARDCHPRSEHLVPLFVIAGAAGNDSGQRDYSGTLMGVAVSGYKFG